MAHHLIFEGAELAGKSWLMSQVYDFLEPKYNQSKIVLDGCHWLNCDVGIFGTDKGSSVIEHYLGIFEELKNANIIVEKFHLSDIVYNKLHRSITVDYAETEDELVRLGFKTICCTFPEDKMVLEKRIQDRLNIYPHYQRILQKPEWYIKQQQEYLKELKNSRLPYLIIETDRLPDEKLPARILDWLGEK